MADDIIATRFAHDHAALSAAVHELTDPQLAEAYEAAGTIGSECEAELRTRLAAWVAAGESQAKIGERIGRSQDTVKRWCQKWDIKSTSKRGRPAGTSNKRPSFIPGTERPKAGSRTKVGVLNDPDVHDWVRKRRAAAGLSANELANESKRGSNGWPDQYPDGTSAQTLMGVIAIVDAVDEATAGELPKTNGRPKNPSGKTAAQRKRELKARDFNDLVRLQQEVGKLVTVIRDYAPEDFRLDEVTMGVIADVYDDLMDLSFWTDRAISMTQGWMEDGDVKRKIAALRDTTGRTPAEAETALRLAQRLEDKLERRLSVVA